MRIFFQNVFLESSATLAFHSSSEVCSTARRRVLSKRRKKLPFKNFFPTSLQAEKIKWGSQLRTYFLPSPRSPVRIKGSPWPDIEKERLDTVRALGVVVKRLETRPKVPIEVPFFPTWGRGTGWIWSNWLGSPGTHHGGQRVLICWTQAWGTVLCQQSQRSVLLTHLHRYQPVFLELFLSCLRCWFFTWHMSITMKLNANFRELKKEGHFRYKNFLRALKWVPTW